jgi:hypothetical protein
MAVKGIGVAAGLKEIWDRVGPDLFPKNSLILMSWMFE